MFFEEPVIFRVPTPPELPETLLTSQEVTRFKGKVKSLKKLAKLERAAHPEINSALTQLATFLAILVYSADLPFIQERRAEVITAMKRVTVLEDVIIRYIVNGEEYSGLAAEANMIIGDGSFNL